MNIDRPPRDHGVTARSRRFHPVGALVTLAVLAYLLFAVLSGLPFWHEHPSAPPHTRETFTSGGVLVHLADNLGERYPPSVRSGVIWGAGFFAGYEELPLRPATGPVLDGEGTEVVLRDPARDDPSRRITFVFAPEAPRPVRATTTIEGEEPHALTGTVALDSLDWAAPGPHTCTFSLHSEEDGGTCYRGWFSVAR